MDLAADSSARDSAIGQEEIIDMDPDAGKIPMAKATRKPRIRYRVEYRHRKTDELIHFHTSDNLDDDDGHGSTGPDGPVFELVRIYKVRGRPGDEDGGDNDKPGPFPAGAHSSPSYHIHIYSLAIINALQSVVQYYPGQDLTGESIIVKWPYPILVHHYDELSKFREDCAAKEPETLCIREKDAYEHVGVLLSFLDENVMEEVAAEKERNKKGFKTWEWWWVGVKPGSVVLEKIREDQDWHARVVHSISGGVYDNPPVSWRTTFWQMAWDGDYLGRFTSMTNNHKFDGESDCRNVMRSVDLSAEPLDEDAAKIIAHGEQYWKLLRKQCKYFKGKTRAFPHTEVRD
jgi:hypothetical protein